eukprot:644838-Prymnesium_polylepis.2
MAENSLLRAHLGTGLSVAQARAPMEPASARMRACGMTTRSRGARPQKASLTEVARARTYPIVAEEDGIPAMDCESVQCGREGQAYDKRARARVHEA